MNVLKTILIWSFIFIYQPILASAADQTVSAKELLQAADRARGDLAEGISWKIKVTATDNDGVSKREFDVKAKGNDAYVESLDRGNHKGERMLFNDRTIWFFKIGTKKPVSLSARQRLSGQALNGDIASTNYNRDYTGAIIGTDIIDGVPAFKLDLKATQKNVTYDRIRYWISKDKKLGIKAEFLTLEGEVFKQAYFKYENTLKVNNKNIDFVSQMTISDPNFKALTTVIEYISPKLSNISDSIFNVNNIMR